MKHKKIKQNILRFLGNYFLFHFINVLCKTLRFEIINQNTVNDLVLLNDNFILTFWHGTMLIPWFLHRNKKIAALTSKSKDGEILARILKKWNYKVIRGSSSKGGDEALGLMVDYAKNKSSIAITPDGPKGPAHKMKAGAVVVSKKSGCPVILVGVGVEKKKKLKSWDKFEIPVPFSRVKVIYSDPVYVDENLSYDDTSKMIKESENMLNQLQNEAGVFN